MAGKHFMDDELRDVVIEMAREYLRIEIPRIRRQILGRLVDNWQLPIFLVKGTSNVTAGNSGTFKFYGALGDTHGSETDVGDESISVYVRFGDYTANKWALAAAVGLGYEMLITECA